MSNMEPLSQQNSTKGEIEKEVAYTFARTSLDLKEKAASYKSIKDKTNISIDVQDLQDLD